VLLWAGNGVLLGLVCGGCACAVSVWARGEGIGLLNLASWPGWLSIPMTIVGLDLVSYLWHRANHRIPLLWRFHQAHHSDRRHTVTTALRFHPGELLLALPVRLFAVIVLGAPVAGLIAFEVVFAFANLWEHGDIDLPAKLEDGLARVVITPALHRRHHSVEAQLLNSNYGTILSVWDRLLATFGESRSRAQIETGLPALPEPIGAAQVLALPVRGVFRGR
jgi:sterol desaturase/sphingolipid hydroxylase (fatty acid hydroxylase superfamily)